MRAMTVFRVRSLLIATVAVCAVVGEARAVELVTNGGFELGFAGWTRADQVGSDGTFLLQMGTTSPVNGIPVPAPPQGVRAAMTDAEGPGSHVLYQDFAVPLVVPSAVLSFDLFVGYRAMAFFTPNTLDFATPALNQQARVDIDRAATAQQPRWILSIRRRGRFASSSAIRPGARATSPRASSPTSCRRASAAR